MKIIANYPATKLKMNSRLAIALKEYDETGSLSEVRLKLVMEGVRQHLNNQKPWSVTQSTSLKDISSRAKVCAVVEHYR
jgi:DNA polymerase elongation subunit (family B)